MALIRKNIQMSEEIAQYYEIKSKEMGVSQSALMSIALKEYIDKENAMNLFTKMQSMVDDMKEIQKLIPKK